MNRVVVGFFGIIVATVAGNGVTCGIAGTVQKPDVTTRRYKINPQLFMDRNTGDSFFTSRVDENNSYTCNYSRLTRNHRRVLCPPAEALAYSHEQRHL